MTGTERGNLLDQIRSKILVDKDERNEARRVAADVVGLAIKLAATLPAHSRKFFWRELAGRTVRALRSPDRQNEETELATKEPNQ